MENIIDFVLYNALIYNRKDKFGIKIPNTLSYIPDNCLGVFVGIKEKKDASKNDSIIKNCIGYWSRYFSKLSKEYIFELINKYTLQLLDNSDFIMNSQYIFVVYFMILPVNTIDYHTGLITDSELSKKRYYENDNVLIQNKLERCVYINDSQYKTWAIIKKELLYKIQNLVGDPVDYYVFDTIKKEVKLINILNNNYLTYIKTYYIDSIYDTMEFNKNNKNKNNINNLKVINDILVILHNLDLKVDPEFLKKILKQINRFRILFKNRNFHRGKDIAINLLLVFNSLKKINKEYTDFEFEKNLFDLFYINLNLIGNKIQRANICYALNEIYPYKNILMSYQKKMYRELDKDYFLSPNIIERCTIEAKFLESLSRRWKNTINIDEHAFLIIAILTNTNIDNNSNTGKIANVFEGLMCLFKYIDLANNEDKIQIYDRLYYAFCLLQKRLAVKYSYKITAQLINGLEKQ